jgi:homoserine kinase
LLTPLAGELGVLGVALSGAGPGILLVTEADADTAAIAARIRAVAGESVLEVIETGIAAGASLSLGLTA